METEIKLFLPEHLKLIQAWHKERKLQFTGCDVGLILYRDGEPETGLFAFINQTNELAFINGQVSKPGLDPIISYENLMELTIAMEHFVKEDGVKMVITVGENGYGKMTERLGYEVCSTKMIETVKLIT